MAKYSKRSIQRIEECHENLQLIAYELIHHMDVIVLCGHRNQADQDRAFAQGKSKLKWPKSKHNKTPSMAIDIAPYNPKTTVDWNDIVQFEIMCGLIKQIAKELGIKIRQGKDFSFKDWVHTELV